MGTDGGGQPGWGLLVGEFSGVWNGETLGHRRSWAAEDELRGAATWAVSVASNKLGDWFILIVSSFLTTKTWFMVVVVVIVDCWVFEFAEVFGMLGVVPPWELPSFVLDELVPKLSREDAPFGWLLLLFEVIVLLLLLLLLFPFCGLPLTFFTGTFLLLGLYL